MAITISTEGTNEMVNQIRSYILESSLYELKLPPDGSEKARKFLKSIQGGYTKKGLSNHHIGASRDRLNQALTAEPSQRKAVLDLASKNLKTAQSKKSLSKMQKKYYSRFLKDGR